MKIINGKGMVVISGVIMIIVIVALIRSAPLRHAFRRPKLAIVPFTSKNSTQPANLMPPNRPALRAGDMTDAEQNELMEKFQKQFKPAIEKWCEAYSNHVLFSSEDVTLDKFHSRLGINFYTFMIGSNTLTFQSPRDGPAKVFYIASGDSLKKMNSMPNPGTIPELTLPVSREDVIRMVKADSGVEFKLNECVMKPTGISGALNGGATIHMLPTGSDPENGLSSKIDLVFGPDGKLVYYDRHPFF